MKDFQRWLKQNKGLYSALSYLGNFISKSLGNTFLHHKVLRVSLSIFTFLPI